MLYNALAESYVQYGLSSYGRTFKSYLMQIHKLQLKIIKNIVSSNVKNQFINDDSSLFRHCKVLPVQTQFKNIFLKNYFFESSQKKERNHPVYTRAVAQGRFATVRANNTYGERTASYLTPRLINQLPLELRNSITPNNIKNKLKAHFLQHWWRGEA